jgi:hypothetical protein
MRRTRSARRKVTDTIRMTPIESEAALSFPEDEYKDFPSIDVTILAT